MRLVDLFSFIFPERCIGCDKEGSVLCAICERTITAKPVAHSGTTATLFDYRHPLIKKAIWALKYHRRRSIARYFGTALYREFFQALARRKSGGALREEIILIPIPGNRKAITMRGYNHASLIARTICELGTADAMHIRVADDILYKKHENEPQAHVPTRNSRASNVEGIFAIRGAEQIYGKTVILIDDVITTGATIRDAKRAVKAGLPKRVLALGVAH